MAYIAARKKILSLTVLKKIHLEDSLKHRGRRKRLVDELRQKGIRNEDVLKAMNKVPRHFFFPSDFIDRAYEDNAFPIEAGQTISQPFTVAFQTQLLDVKPGHKVLEIGTGSGYQAAILAELGCQVFSIERQEELYRSASTLLAKLGYKVKCFWGDGSEGLAKYGPFDRIVVTAASPESGTVLGEQLVTGGKMVIPVGDQHLQKMLLIEKTVENKFDRTVHGHFKFVPLLGKYGWNG